MLDWSTEVGTTMLEAKSSREMASWASHSNLIGSLVAVKLESRANCMGLDWDYFASLREMTLLNSQKWSPPLRLDALSESVRLRSLAK